MSNYSMNLKFYYNLFFLFILILYVKNQEILNECSENVTNGEVCLEYLNNSTEIELNWRQDDYNLIIHILSIDCEIEVDDINKNNFEKISYYNYDAYYLSKHYDNSISLKINPLIPSKKQNQNRNYPLIINTIKNSSIFMPYISPVLNVKENEPIFLYFNNDFKSINLFYGNSNIKQPIIISFFTKEKTKFKIEISDQIKIINKIINYKGNIIFNPEYYADYDISISLEEDINNSTMMVKIFQNNSSPIYFQKNQLNLGFIPIELDYYYYYMEIFKGEKGEIILFNKRQNAILISKIIEKDNNIIPKVNEFPQYNENESLPINSFEFNIYHQKLSFNTSLTPQKCEEGCFLLITIYSNIPKSLDINGTEFSILSRIWEEDEKISQIINIPLDEYIFGYFDEMINIHYYSVFIPNETYDIYIEIHGKNIFGYYQEGINQINTANKDNIFKFEKCQNKMIIKLNPKDIGLESFKGKYISLAFEKDINDIHSPYYYFRIIQQNSEKKYIIYPLDTNKENYCETKNKTCYFLLRNEYNELSNRIFIYNLEKNNISCEVFYKNENDYYSKNLNLDNLNEDKDESKEIQSFNGLLNFDLKKNENFILIRVKSKEEANLTILSNVYKQSNSTSINIYSYQLYHLSDKQCQKFNLIQNSNIKYRVFINNIEGEGFIYYNQISDNTNNDIHITEQRIYSFSISNKESFLVCAKNDLIYYIKIIDDIPNVIKELNYQSNLEKLDSNTDFFPLIYFIKDVKYNGIYINFIFKFNDSNNENNTLEIKGYELNYSEILSIKSKSDVKKIGSKEIKGKYDNITNSGTIELS